MKLTKQALQQIIKEELRKVLLREAGLGWLPNSDEAAGLDWITEKVRGGEVKDYMHADSSSGVRARRLLGKIANVYATNPSSTVRNYIDQHDLLSKWIQAIHAGQKFQMKASRITMDRRERSLPVGGAQNFKGSAYEEYWEGLEPHLRALKKISGMEIDPTLKKSIDELIAEEESFEARY